MDGGQGQQVFGFFSPAAWHHHRYARQLGVGHQLFTHAGTDKSRSAQYNDALHVGLLM